MHIPNQKIQGLTVSDPLARLFSTTPCSSLLAAARSVDEVLPASTKGVPGRLFPCELLAEPFRSFLGGVFFFCERRKTD